MIKQLFQDKILLVFSVSVVVLLLVLLLEIYGMTLGVNANAMTGQQGKNITPENIISNTTSNQRQLNVMGLKQAPIRKYHAIVLRSLFTPERKGVLGDGASNKSSTKRKQILEKWKLTGIVKAGEDAYALIHTRRGNTRLKLEQGKTVDGWVLDAIASQHITLRSGRESVDLVLFEKDPDQITAKTPPASTKHQSLFAIPDGINMGKRQGKQGTTANGKAGSTRQRPNLNTIWGPGKQPKKNN